MLEGGIHIMTAQLDAVSTGGSHLFADSLVQGFNVDPARANEIAAAMRRPYCFNGSDTRSLTTEERVTVTYHLLKEYMPDNYAWELAHQLRDEVTALTFTCFGTDRFYSLVVG